MKIRPISRLCYIANSIIPSHWANSVHVMKMCAAFATQGVQTELIIPFRCSEWWQVVRQHIDVWDRYAIPSNFRLTRLAYPHIGQRFKVRGYALTAAIWARWRSPDLVYANNIWAAYWLSRWAQPVVFEGHDLLEEQRWPSFQPLLQEADRTPALRGIVTISQGLADAYVIAGAPSHKVHVLREGVDLERFEPVLSKIEARRQVGLQDSRSIVCYAGNLYKGRGIEETLECARHLSGVLFVFVGGRTRDIERYQSFCDREGLDKVLFVGMVANATVPAYLYAADVLIMPYTSRVPTVRSMSPMKMFEYMAAGRPIVATDFPTIREVLTHEHNAILVEPDNAEGLQAGIQHVLCDPVLSERIAQQAQLDVEQYSWSNRAAAILERFVDAS